MQKSAMPFKVIPETLDSALSDKLFGITNSRELDDVYRNSVEQLKMELKTDEGDLAKKLSSEVHTLISQSHVQRQLGQYDKAIEFAEKAIEKDKDNPWGYLALALAQLHVGNYKGATENTDKISRFMAVSFAAMPVMVSLLESAAPSNNTVSEVNDGAGVASEESPKKQAAPAASGAGAELPTVVVPRREGEAAPEAAVADVRVPEQLKSLRREIATLKQSLLGQEDASTKLRTVQEDESKRLTKALDKFEKLKKTVEASQEEHKKSESLKREWLSKVSTFNSDLVAQNEQVEELKKEIHALRQKMTQQSASLLRLERAEEVKANAESEQKALIEKLRTELESEQKARIAQLERELDKDRRLGDRRNTNHRGAISRVDDAVKALIQRRNAERTDFSEFRRGLEQVHERCETLERKLAEEVGEGIIARSKMAALMRENESLAQQLAEEKSKQKNVENQGGADISAIRDDLSLLRNQVNALTAQLETYRAQPHLPAGSLKSPESPLLSPATPEPVSAMPPMPPQEQLPLANYPYAQALPAPGPHNMPVAAPPVQSVPLLPMPTAAPMASVQTFPAQPFPAQQQFGAPPGYPAPGMAHAMGYHRSQVMQAQAMQDVMLVPVYPESAGTPAYPGAGVVTYFLSG